MIGLDNIKIMNEAEKRETEPTVPVEAELFDEERTKDSLLQEGLEEKDVKAAITMTKNISRLNKLLFNDTIPIVYIVGKDESDKRRIASYKEPDKDGTKEGYYIHIHCIVNNANSYMQNLKMWFDKDGKIKTGDMGPDGVALAFDEFMFGLAAHEVRHRVQQKPDFKKIDMSKDIENSYKDKDSEKDARVIGYKAMKAFHKGKTIEQIAKILGKID